MRVSVCKTSGKLIEAQSNDDVSFDGLIKNAINFGFKINDIETKHMSKEELYKMIEIERNDSIEYKIKSIDEEMFMLNRKVPDGLEELLISWEIDGKFEPRKRPAIVDEIIKRKAELRAMRKELTK